MANKRNWLGMAVLALSFGLVLAGCDADGDDTPSGGAPTTVTGITIYTLNGTTFTEYAGTGTVQTITGEVGEDNRSSIGSIGTISADGKLTLNLPTTVADDKLFEYQDIKIKGGRLKTTPNIYLAKSSDDIIIYQYFNQAYSDSRPDHVSISEGWNYNHKNTGLVASADGYKWVIDTGSN